VRVYLIGRNYQPTEIDIAEATRRFLAWLADAANPALTDLVQIWMWRPPDSGGLGALAESPGDVARLRAQAAATWQHDPGDREIR
jgi:hypothetical protein